MQGKESEPDGHRKPTPPAPRAMGEIGHEQMEGADKKTVRVHHELVRGTHSSTVIRDYFGDQQLSGPWVAQRRLYELRHQARSGPEGVSPLGPAHGC
jgi:hypothetical protein